MIATKLIPILNVSNIEHSFTWFEKLGWQRRWHWGEPPSFASVGSGAFEIFMCENGQGGRGRGGTTATFGCDGEEEGDRGVWMSIFVEDVDEVHQHCLEQGLEITWPPTDMPWSVREMHVRHPDGHVFRIGQGIEDEDED
jgi:uncharacterized glyoxalase superfamily protein PhnB